MITDGMSHALHVNLQLGAKQSDAGITPAHTTRCAPEMIGAQHASPAFSQALSLHALLADSKTMDGSVLFC